MVEDQEVGAPALHHPPEAGDQNIRILAAPMVVEVELVFEVLLGRGPQGVGVLLDQVERLTQSVGQDPQGGPLDRLLEPDVADLEAVLLGEPKGPLAGDGRLAGAGAPGEEKDLPGAEALGAGLDPGVVKVEPLRDLLHYLLGDRIPEHEPIRAERLGVPEHPEQLFPLARLEHVGGVLITLRPHGDLGFAGGE